MVPTDLDLEKGVWWIKKKDFCPTKYGLKWSAKRGKERKVPLLLETIELLKSMPRHQAVGRVPIRDEKQKIIGYDIHPTQYLFPKKSIRKLPSGVREISYERLDSTDAT